MAAALLAVALFACSTFSGDDVPAADGGGGDLDGTSAADAAPPDAGVADAPLGMPVEAGHDAQFSLNCGMTSCRDAGDGCCRDQNKTPPEGYYCAPPMDICPFGQHRYTCDDDDDCTVLLGKSGTVCCGSLGAAGSEYFLSGTTCALPENCVGASDVRLCDRTVPGQCPAGKPCVELGAYAQPGDDAATWPIIPPIPACEP